MHSTFFFFNDTATTEIYTLSLHDALPISDALNEAQHRQDHCAPDSNLLVGRHERHQKGGDPHDQQPRDQCRLAADASAEMSEDRGADGARQEADGINGECLERADQRIGFREVQLGEHESGHPAVQKKVVPLDGGADGGGDDCTPELNSDRKSTRLNSSHSQISYAVFCLKKKKQTRYIAQSSTPPPLLHPLNCTQL